MPTQSMTRATAARPVTPGNDHLASGAWDHCPPLQAPLVLHDIGGTIAAASILTTRSFTSETGGDHGFARR